MDIKSLTLIATLVLAWSGLLWGAIRWLLNQYQNHIDGRFGGLEKAFGKETERIQALEREVLELKADLPQLYVRREDQIRSDTYIHAKLDAIWQKIDRTGAKDD